MLDKSELPAREVGKRPLDERRQVAEHTMVTAPCESALLLATRMGSTFSVIVGRRKWIS
jgi:allantoin racemase